MNPHQRIVNNVETALSDLDNLVNSHPVDCECGLCIDKPGLDFVLRLVRDLVQSEERDEPPVKPKRGKGRYRLPSVMAAK